VTDSGIALNPLGIISTVERLAGWEAGFCPAITSNNSSFFLASHPHLYGYSQQAEYLAIFLCNNMLKRPVFTTRVSSVKNTKINHINKMIEQ